MADAVRCCYLLMEGDGGGLIAGDVVILGLIPCADDCVSARGLCGSKIGCVPSHSSLFCNILSSLEDFVSVRSLTICSIVPYILSRSGSTAIARFHDRFRVKTVLTSDENRFR